MTTSYNWLWVGVSLFMALAVPLTPARAQDPSGQALMDANHWKRVRSLAQRLAQSQPNDANTFYLLAEEKQAFGDDAGALPLAQKAVMLNGNSAAYHMCLSEIYGDMAEHAGIFKQMSLARSFKSEAEKAAALDPKNTDVRFHLVQFYLEAPSLIGGGKDKAYTEATEIARLNNAKGFVAQAIIATHEKDTAKALSLYEKAVQADPNDYDAMISLASLYSSDSIHRYDDAERLCREALKAASDRIAAYTILATIYAQHGEWSDLDGILADAAKNVPDDAGAHYQAGKVLLVKGDSLPRAENYFRLYLTQEPEAGSPPLSAAHWRLAGVLEKENRKQEAIAELQTALGLQPNFAQAKEDLKRLK
ncbi:MAG TPA: hypothetical protein VKB26_07425 [Candidatus Acidoferrales bacterium]|nr:hypothetical protein [Candidatus Acidoferrales bacterium]